MLQSINEAKNESLLDKMLETILSIESIYNQNPQYGLDLIDRRILKRLKTNLSLTISQLEFYNINLIIDDDFKSFAIREIPRIQINFNPRYKAYFNENEDAVAAENDNISYAVNTLNKKIFTSRKKHIDDVRLDNLSIEDGFLLKINLESIDSVESFKKLCEFFVVESMELSLEEVFLSQQLTTKFILEKSKPYSLHKINKDSPKMLYVQLVNTKNLDSEFYIQPLFLHIISNFNNMFGRDKVVSFRSINNSYVTINFY